MQITLVGIAQMLMTLLPFIVKGGSQIWALIESIRRAAQQDAEWPPEAEVAYQMALLKKADSDAARPDPQ